MCCFSFFYGGGVDENPEEENAVYDTNIFTPYRTEYNFNLPSHKIWVYGLDNVVNLLMPTNIPYTEQNINYQDPTLTMPRFSDVQELVNNTTIRLFNDENEDTLKKDGWKWGEGMEEYKLLYIKSLNNSIESIHIVHKNNFPNPTFSDPNHVSPAPTKIVIPYLDETGTIEKYAKIWPMEHNVIETIDADEKTLKLIYAVNKN